MRLDNYQALWLLWLLPVLAGFYVYSFHRKRQALRRFAAAAPLARINQNVSLPRQSLKAALLIIAAAAVIIALTGPGWNPHTEKIQRKGRDIVVLLDVSRSMLAEDLKPNRLAQSKLAVGDLLDVLDGDRIAIVTFAGSAVVKCPLTQDYSFAKLVLADIGTESVGQGGTLIGDAIRKVTTDVFDRQERDFKDVILITDGEDHGSFPIEAAQQAGAEGIRIFVIGLGNQNEGTRIPITDPQGQRTFLKYDGKEVWSKLDADTLDQIARATPGGGYLGVATGAFNLNEVYDRAIVTAGKKQLASTTVQKYDEKFQIFCALALALIVAEALISERKKNT